MSLSVRDAIVAVRAGRLDDVRHFPITANSRFADAVWDFDQEAGHDDGFVGPPRICFDDLFCKRRLGASLHLEPSTRSLMFLLKTEGRSWPTVWQFAQTLRRAHQVMLGRGIRRWSRLRPADYSVMERVLTQVGQHEVERLRLLLNLAQLYALESTLVDAPPFPVVLSPDARRSAPRDLGAQVGQMAGL
jgi:hypothetical protein